MDKISIILPVYNVEKYIERCIKSLIDQTYKNIEIILIDDGSNDNSGKICDKYSIIDNRIKVTHKENEGVSNARNFGIDRATGKYICFVDPDDFVEKDYIEVLYNVLKENEEDNKNIISVCKYFRIENDKIINPEEEEKSSVLDKEDFLKRVLLEDDLGGGVCWNKMFPTELSKKIKFDENLSVGEDLKFIYLVLKEIDEVIISEKKLYNSVLRVGSLSKTYNEVDLKKEEILCKEILNDIEKNYPSIYEYALKRYMVSLSYLLTYCNNPKKYNKEKKNGQLKLFKILFSDSISVREKIYIFSKISFPTLYKKIRNIKHKKSRC